MAENINKLKNVLQQDLLSWLLFDDKSGGIVKNTLQLEHWSGNSPFVRFINSVYTYYDNYKEAPKAHTANLIDELNINKDEKDLLMGMINLSQNRLSNLNSDYLMNSLSEFYKQAVSFQLVMQSAKLINDGKADEGIELISSLKSLQLKLFNPGKTIMDRLDEWTNFNPEEEAKDKILLGIDALDKNDIVPMRQQLFVFGAIYNAGKSFFLTYVGQKALEAKKKVLHITLELKDDLTLDRYLSAFFKFASRPEDQGPRYVIKNAMVDMMVPGRPKITRSPEALEEALAYVDQNYNIATDLRVVEFPTVSVTLGEIEAYIDSLNDFDGFKPDVVIIDYADNILVRGSKKEHYEDLEDLYRNLRRIAQEKNLCMVTATQLNGEAINACNNKKADSIDLHGGMTAGAKAKMNEVDIGLIYSQAPHEKEQGIAKLIVDKSRSSSKPSVIISQNYALGQFCTGSMILDHSTMEEYKKLAVRLKSDQV